MGNAVVAAVTVYKLPWLIKQCIVKPILALLTKVPTIEKIFTSSEDMRDNVHKRDEFTRSYLESMSKAGVDLIICPGQMLPAPPTGVLGTFVAPVLNYTPWNVMNFPAGIAPVTTWTDQDSSGMSESLGFSTNWPKQRHEQAPVSKCSLEIDLFIKGNVRKTSRYLLKKKLVGY